MVPVRYDFDYTENEIIYPFISGKDAYDLMTGAWVPRKGPSSSLFLIADTRPLILRAVGSRSNYFDMVLIIIASSQVPYILSFSLFMILAGLTLPRTSGASGYCDSSSHSINLVSDCRLLTDILLCSLVYSGCPFHRLHLHTWPRLRRLAPSSSRHRVNSLQWPRLSLRSSWDGIRSRPWQTEV